MSSNENRVIEMLKTAVDMEEKGKKFYERTIVECGNDLGRDIFTMLKKDEDIHIERIKKIYNSISGGKGWNTDWQRTAQTNEELKDVFRKMAKNYGREMTGTASDIKALDIGIDFEGKSKEFYKKSLEFAEDDIEKKFIQMMIKEEQGHYDTLVDMKLYLTDPSAWFVENERHGMDGA